MSHIRSALIVATAAIVTALASRAAMADGDLSVMPTRLVLEGTRRAAAISLINTGHETATYRLAFQRQRMTEQGTFTNVGTPEPEERFSDTIVRFSPHLVTLRPGEAQTVRVQVVKPSQLETGEYRSHLVIRAVPQPRAIDPAGHSADDNALGVHLTPVFGISVPVIVRQGDTAAQVTLSDLKLERATDTQAAALQLHIQRSGTRSVFGDIKATVRMPDGRDRLIATINGVAVYTPNASRIVNLPIRMAASEVPHGAVHVTYTSKPDDGSRLIAECTGTI